MSELPDPYKNLPLSDDELKTIARIAINWAHADSVIGNALSAAYRLDPPISQRATSVAKDLIHPLEMGRKISLLISLRKANRIPDTAELFLTELKYAQDNFKTVRNVLSHGMIMSDAAGNWSGISGKGPMFDADELPLALEQSKYVALMANRVFFAVARIPIPATSFERPPRQLPR
jgi:hypothetical protein